MNTKQLLIGVLVIVVGTSTAYAFLAPESRTLETATQSNDASPLDIPPTGEQTTQTEPAQPEVQQTSNEPTFDTEKTGVSERQPDVSTSPVSPAKPLVPSVATYTSSEVSTHDSGASCWTIVRNMVYDLTPFIDEHPGGADNILRLCGIDGTQSFEKKHAGESKPEAALEGHEIGVLAQ